AGQRPETGAAQLPEILRQLETHRLRPLPDLQRGKRVDVQFRDGALDRADDRFVVLTGESRMNPALKTHFGRAALPGFARTPDDLVKRNEIRGSAQIRGQFSFRERAEAAAEVADVRVLDVSRDDVGHVVTARLATQTIGGGEHAVQLLAAGAEQTHELRFAELVSRIDR